MAQICCESYECKVPAKRMWYGLFKDAHNCLPKALPHKIASVEYPEGHGLVAGAVRIIKFHKAVGTLHKAGEAAEKFVHEEALLVKETAEEVVHTVHKAGEAAEKLAHEEALLVKMKAEEAGCTVLKAGEATEELLHHEAHLAEKKTEEVGGTIHKVGEAVEKLPHEEALFVKEKAEEGVDITHKVGDEAEKFIDHEVLFVKEKIEEVDHDAFKIKVAVLGGGLLAFLFKHYKHTFEIKEGPPAHGGGCFVHWTTEFETLAAHVVLHHALDELKETVLEPVKKVEAYLLEHHDHYA